MSTPLTREILQRRANVGLIAAFFIFLCLPTADTFLRLDRTPKSNENRAPARFPQIAPSLAGIQRYVTGIESYFADHFGFRNRLVAWSHNWKWQFFRTSAGSKSTRVLTGKSGWLYYAGGLLFDDIAGNKPFSDKQLAEWLDLLRTRRDWLAKKGIRYMLVIPPDKHTIYPEYLPNWLASTARPPQRLEQFVQYMKAHGDVTVLDLRPALLEAKKSTRVYYQTDTHWNQMGAFVACRRIVEEAAALGIDTKPVDASAFQISTSEGDSGDLAKMLGQNQPAKEKDIVFVTPKPPLAIPPIAIAPELQLKKRVEGCEPLRSVNPAAKGKLLLFRDSFAINLSHYLGFSFGRVTYVWQQNWDKRIIEAEKPDIVVDEILERFVLVRDPLELKKKDDQPDETMMADL